MTTAHINLIDKDGYLRQIFKVNCITRYRPTEEQINKAESIAKEACPGYRSAILVISHYDKNDYNDKCNYIAL